MMKKFTIGILTFIGTLSVASLVPADDKQRVFKDWIVICQEDVFNEKRPFSCFMGTNGRSKDMLIVEKEAGLDAIGVISEGDAENISSFPAKVKMKTGKGKLQSGKGTINPRNDTHMTISFGFEEEQMAAVLTDLKAGSEVNTLITILGNEYKDKFSLRGFTAAYSFMRDADPVIAVEE